MAMANQDEATMEISPRFGRRSMKSWLQRKLQVRWIGLQKNLEQAPLIPFLMAAAVGICLCQTGSWSILWSILLWVGCLLSFLIALIKCWSWSRLALGGVILTSFASLHSVYLNDLSHDRSFQLATSQWSPVVLEGIVQGVPRWRPDVQQYEDRGVQRGEDAKWQTLFDLRMTQVRDRTEWKSAEGLLTVSVEGNLRDILAGDRLRIYGVWQRIPSPTNPGQFDLAAHYRRKGQFVRVRIENPEQVRHLEGTQQWRLDRWMGTILEQGDRALHRSVILGQSNLASALVLGQKDQVEWELQESLLATGTMHMLAISGLHVDMVAISLMTLALLLHLPRKLTLLLISLTIIGYGVLCGGQPPVVRAVILVVAICIAKWNGRTTHSLNLLALAGLILLAYRTTNLFDVGTQLSFLAVAMLSVLSMNRLIPERDADPIQQLLYESYPAWKRWCIDVGYRSWEILRTSTWIWMITTPLILSTFHVISPIAIVLNLVLWIPLFVALLSGLMVVLFAGWLPPMEWLGGIACGSSLWLSEKCIDYAAEFSFGHAWLPAPPLSWTLGFYGLLLVLSLVLGFGKSKRVVVGTLLIAWCCAGVLPSWLELDGRKSEQTAENAKLKMTVIDVGHGTSILLDFPNGETWLYDAGRMGDSDRSFQNIAAVLWHENLCRIDGIFLSHADADHYNAIEGIAKRFRPQRFATTEQVLSHSSEKLRETLRQLRRHTSTWDTWAEGGTMELADSKIVSLHPPPRGVPGSDNANSLCLSIEYGGRCILLTGDLEAPGTQSLLRHPSRDVDVLLAPHHGSLSQTPKPLLDWCRPKIVAISGGPRSNRPKVIEAYADEDRLVLLTQRSGALRIEIDSNGMMETFHWTDQGWESQPIPANSVAR